MSIKKKFLKSKPICKVTFRIPKSMANGATRANLVGEFNDWSVSAHPMKRLKNGEFTTTVALEKNREYQFRYLLEDRQWENDSEADKFAPTPFEHTQNSVIVL